MENVNFVNSSVVPVKVVEVVGKVLLSSTTTLEPTRPVSVEVSVVLPGITEGML
jgi:hypothetical protein